MGIAETVFGLIIFGIGATAGLLYERKKWREVTGVKTPEGVIGGGSGPVKK